jgi:hypothetical protein
VIAQSGWLAEWVDKLRFISVVLGDCRIERVPVQITARRDNLAIWWIPLPQIGGSPYTHYRAQLEVDAKVCAVTGHRG